MNPKNKTKLIATISITIFTAIVATMAPFIFTVILFMICVGPAGANGGCSFDKPYGFVFDLVGSPLFTYGGMIICPLSVLLLGGVVAMKIYNSKKN